VRRDRVLHRLQHRLPGRRRAAGRHHVHAARARHVRIELQVRRPGPVRRCARSVRVHERHRVRRRQPVHSRHVRDAGGAADWSQVCVHAGAGRQGVPSVGGHLRRAGALRWRAHHVPARRVQHRLGGVPQLRPASAMWPRTATARRRRARAIALRATRRSVDRRRRRATRRIAATAARRRAGRI
jgi:hypothetical protein